MSEEVCAVAADTKVETPEGALAIRTVAGKTIAVFTREPSGRVRFRLMRDVRKIAEQQPTLKITLENGQSFRVSGGQVLYKKAIVECRADALQVGDALEPAFHFPLGYKFRNDLSGEIEESIAALRVVRIEPGGIADVYALGVNQTGCFFLTAGVLCKAEGATGAGGLGTSAAAAS